MSLDVEKLLHDAMALSERDRAELAVRLLETLDVGLDDVRASWHQEISRRVAELDQGAVAPVPLDRAHEVFRDAINE